MRESIMTTSQPEIQLIANVVATNPSGEVLFVKYDLEDERWWLPGGDLEPYEHPDDRAGYRVQGGDLIGTELVEDVATHRLDVLRRSGLDRVPTVAGEADPRASQGKRATVIFDIHRDCTPVNIRLETSSGSPSLDTSALHAIQRVDGFGPLPAGDHITVSYTFDYRQP